MSALFADCVVDPGRGSTLTQRQLEVALLLRGGLRHAEIAEQLGISVRQVARLAGQARERMSAGTSSHLVAMLAHSDRAIIAAAGIAA